jgi:hypothetical protein
MNFKLFVIFSLLLYVAKSDDDERTLSMKLNPGCTEQLASPECEVLSFLHVEAASSNDSLHYLWDFTGFPSILLAKTPHNTSLIINWTDFMKGSPNTVRFSNSPDFVFSTVIHKFLLFDDKNDKGNVSDVPADQVIEFNPQKFSWLRGNLTALSDEITMLMNATVDNGDDGNGSFVMKVSFCKFLLLGTFQLQSYSD